MPRKRSWRRLRPELIYGFEPEELGGEGDTLVLAEKRAALTAMRAWEARTWGEFAEVAGRSWDELLKDYGDEIKEDCGCLPSPGERFWYGDYLHLDSLRQLIPDPRDEAFFSSGITRSFLGSLRMRVLRFSLSQAAQTWWSLPTRLKRSASLRPRG